MTLVDSELIGREWILVRAYKAAYPIHLNSYMPNAFREQLLDTYKLNNMTDKAFFLKTFMREKSTTTHNSPDG